VKGLLGLAVGGSLAGCDRSFTSTQHETIFCQEIEDGRNLRILQITSDKYSWDQKQDEIGPELERVVNSGEYDIISVKTSYSDAYLTSAEVQYSLSGECGRAPKIMLIQSDEYSWDQKQDEIGPELERVVNSGEYDVLEINTVPLQGYLTAAEVYHR